MTGPIFRGPRHLYRDDPLGPRLHAKRSLIAALSQAHRQPWPPSREDHTPLHAAIEKGLADVVESLLIMERAMFGTAGMVSPTKMSPDGDLPLTMAIKRGHATVVETLLNFMDPEAIYLCNRDNTDAFMALARRWPTLASTTRLDISYYLRRAARDGRYIDILLGIAPDHLSLPPPEKYSLLDHLIGVESDSLCEYGADFSGFVAKDDTEFIKMLDAEGLLIVAVHDAIAEEAERLGKQGILATLNYY